MPVQQTSADHRIAALILGRSNRQRIAIDLDAIVLEGFMNHAIELGSALVSDC